MSEGKRKKPSRVVGNRCVVGGCSNTKRDGFSLYTMPSEPVATVRGWVRFIQSTRKDFQHKNYRKVFVCCGHFTRDQFDSGSLMRYENNFRTLPPTILAGQFPTIKIAVRNPFTRQENEPPFPLLVPTSSASETATTTSITTSSSNMCTLSSLTTTSTSSSSPRPRPVTSHAITATPKSIMTTPCRETQERESGSHGSCYHIPRARKVRRMSTHARRKEVAVIEDDYQKSCEAACQAEMAKPIDYKHTPENDKRIQSKPQMVHRHVTARPGRHSVKIQVKPKSFTRSTGSQTPTVLPGGGVLVSSSSQTDGWTEEEHVTRPEPQPEPEPELEPSEEEEPEEPEDPTWEPDEETISDSSDDECDIYEETIPEDNVANEKKFVVFESNLLRLFKCCTQCRGPCTVEKFNPKNFGTQLKVTATCELCLHEYVWYSQPKVGNVYAGNILLSAAILYAGCSPSKVIRVFNHMKLAAISNGTFMAHQRRYLQPATVQAWREHQAHIITEIKEGEEPLILGGDGRADSPGHCAKYGSYSLMNLKTSKIVEVQLVQSNETTSSNAMELEGLKRCFQKLIEMEGLTITTLVTDRHASVAKWMRDNHALIKHLYDAWHIVKGIKGKIKAVAKIKGCEAAGEWQRSIVNHIYWSAASTPDGNGEVIVAKYKSVLNHMRNIHTGHGHELYDQCQHQPIVEPPRAWLKSDTKVFCKLEDILTRTRLVNDMHQISNLDQTSSLESYHAVLLYFCPKLLSYSYQSMKCRLYLSALHWNENTGRPQARKADGTPRYAVKYPKAKAGGCTVTRVLTAPTYGYVTELITRTLILVKAGKTDLRKEMEELQGKPALCADYYHPSMEEAIAAYHKHHRFAATEPAATEPTATEPVATEPSVTDTS